MLIPISPVVENVCVFKEGTSSPDPNCAVEKRSDTLQSCEPFCITDVDSSERLSASDILRTDVSVGAFTSVRIADSSERADNEGKESVRSGDASEIKHPDILCSSSRRSTCTSKSNQKTETKKATRKCRKTADKKQSLELIFLKVARRRRSCFCKPARPSGWGLLGNISQFFQQNTGPDVNQNGRKKSQKSRSGWGGGKRKKIQTPNNFKRSNGERSASTSRICLKVKLGKELGQSCLMEIVPVIDNDLEKHWGTRREFPKISKDIGGKSEEELVGLGVTVDKGCLDPGTSPDSEVINLTPEAQISGEVAEDLHDVLISSQDYVAQGDITCMSLPTMGRSKGERSTHHQIGKDDCNEDCRFSSPEIINSVVPFKKYGQGDKTGDGFYSSEEASLLTTMTCSSEGFSIEPLASSTVMDFRVSTETLKVESGAQVDLSPSIAVLESPESQILLPCSLPKGKKLPKSSGSRGASKRKKDVIDSVTRRGNTCGLKGNKSILVNKSELKVKGDGAPVVCEVGCHLDPGNHTLDDCGETKHGFSTTAKETSNLEMVQTVVGDQCVPQRNAWVCCDDCFKWRRIAAVLADSIDETNSRWICKDNMDKDFADCSVRQEKSNAEINAELEISDCEEDASGARLNCNKLGQIQSAVPQQSSWKLIRSNLFLHRSRKTQIIDEIMVCNCKTPADGRMGCGDGCLNRMLNIECVKGTCPCGELCSNQQFQKRKYAKLKCFQCGKKGHGLQLLENIPKGRFLIEYVGEVLDVHAYEARQREYASKGHKHFYFMTLNGSEVIDACVKGNLGRFVNHSCEPNCRTEKWMVNGEVCVGLFAIRDIKKGEELTFDYNYVRVFGAAAKKCVCGSSQCRGYIGGDPLNTDIIVQGDSDEEFPEPVMVYEDGNTNMDNIVSSTNSFDGAEIQLQTEEILVKNNDEFDNSGTDIGHLKITEEVQTPEILLEHKDETAAVGCIETTIDSEDFLKKSSSVASKLEFSSEMEGSVGVSPCSAQPIENPIQLDDRKSEITSSAQQELSVQRVETYLTTMPSKSSPESIDIKSEFKPEMEGDKRVVSKSHPPVKTSRSASSVKKGKLKISAVSVSKPLDMESKSQKSKKLVEGSSNGDFEAVQEKLNDLIDANGGISKRKDASRGYLKLLFLTAASGDSGSGEAIQSNRDLSMILGALLKTKSRTVLVDIINKNGLQMLHNIMKRYSREFNKIPILRKVLKVFEYLATREILILEHIISGPPCPGVESFRESILALTEHTDRQVYQIARKFRDRWIPRQYRKKNCMRHREDSRVEFHRGSNCNNRFSSASHNNHVPDWSGVMPTEKAIECVEKPVIATTTPVCPTTSCSSTSGVTTNGMTPRKRKTRWDSDFPRYKEIRTSELPSLLDKSTIDGGRSEIMDDEDIPPGFSDPLNKAVALHHENSGPTKYPREAVIGHPQERFVSRLPVSFGIPLSVVNQFGTSSQAEDSVEGWVVAPGMPFHPFPPLPPYPRGEQDFPNPNTPSTSGASQPAMEIPCLNNRHNFQRARGSGNNNLGRRYFRQHKWANSRLPPPWVRKFMGVGTVETRPNGPYKSAEVSHGGQQQPQHQNYH